LTPAVGGIEKFGDVLPEFVSLSESLSIRNPFIEPEWIDAYLKTFEPSSDTFVLTARRNGRLTGLLPLVPTFEHWYGVPARILRAPANSHCHSFEVPREDGISGSDALRAMFSMLDKVDDWDVMELPRLPTRGSTLGELLLLAQERGWHAAQRASASNLFVRLHIGVGKKIDAPWQSTATAKQIEDLHRTERLVKAELDGWICFETIKRPTPEQLSLFFQLESSGWKGSQNAANSSATTTQKFYSEVAQNYAKSNRFVLNLLFLQDHVAAGQLALRTGDSLCGLKLSYDERLSRYSPRSLLINSTLRLCFESAIRRFELGPDSHYNRRWSNQEAPLASYFLFRRGFYGRLLRHYKFLGRPRLKQVLTRLRISQSAK
jgi:hypothetical protein